VLNYIWLALVLLAVAIGGWNDRLKDVTGGALDGAKTAVTIALGLIGIMALWLGLMRLAERAGARPTHRLRFAPVDAAIVSGSSAGPSGDGCEADEHGGEHARAR
jgi:spore maturation protein SpmA